MIWTYKKMVKNTGELFCAESAFSSLAILDRFVRLTDFERLTMESLALAAKKMMQRPLVKLVKLRASERASHNYTLYELTNCSKMSCITCFY